MTVPLLWVYPSTRPVQTRTVTLLRIDASDLADDEHRTESRPRSAPDQLTRWFVAGSAIGSIILLFVLVGGSASLLQNAAAGAMYDAQAHSLLHGHWDIPQTLSSIESFGFGGKTYIYFGPFPALLRLPIAVFTDRFDGRLGQLSILVAVILTVAAAAGVVGEVAHRCVGPHPVGRFARSLALSFGLVITGGSIVTFISFRGDIYNEAIAWGLATALASIAFMLRALRTSSARCIAAAGAFAACALQSRITMGASALAVIGLVLIATLARRTRRMFSLSDALTTRRLRIWLSLATVVPVGVFVAIQEAKFGTLLVRPSNHLVNLAQPQFQTYLQRNGDTYFSTSFVPANFLNTTIWPSGMSFDSAFPWLRPNDLDYGPSPGHPLFLGRSWSGSLAFTQTLLFALGCLGAYRLYVAGLVSRWRPRADPADPRPDAPADLRLVAIAASAGFGATLAYDYQYHRFLADAFPAVITLAAVGLMAALTTRPLWGKRALLMATVTAALWSIWVNSATAILAQTERAWDPSPAALTRLYGLQDSLGARPSVLHIGIGDPLPQPVAIGQLVDIGACDALLASAGTEGTSPLWWPIERGRALKRVLDIEPSLLSPGETALVAAAPNAGGAAISVSAGAGFPEIVVRGDGQETRYPLRDRVSRVVLEVSPVWRTLTMRLGEDMRAVTWVEPLGSIPLAPKEGVTDGGADGMTLCHRLSGN
jgi:hypothetical protein